MCAYADIATARVCVIADRSCVWTHGTKLLDRRCWRDEESPSMPLSTLVSVLALGLLVLATDPARAFTVNSTGTLPTNR